MAHVEVSKLSPQELAQLSCTYAALILHDDGQDITGEKIGKLVTAAGVKIESYWPKLFAKALVGKDISSFFNFGGQVSSAASAVTAPAVTAPVAEKKEDKKADDKKGKQKKQQKKKEAPPPPPEEEDGGMGDLFG